MRYSIVNFSDVKAAEDFRIDAHYWHPVFIRNSSLVTPHQKLRDFVHQNIANIKSAPINRDFEYLEISQISLSNFEYQTTTVQLGEEPDRAHHLLEKGDVIVSTVRPNRNAIAFIKADGIVGSSGLAILRPKNIEAEYLLAFCKTDYFVNCLMRSNKASMYPAVSIRDVLDTPLFVPSKSLRLSIVETVKNSDLALNKSKQIYAQAQTLFLSELGLAAWQPKQQLTFVKNFSDTEGAGRIDADYFQPKYNEIVDTIKNYSGGWDTLENQVCIKDTNFNPDAETEYKYIELANIGNSGEIIDCMVEHGEDLPTRARRKVAAEDVIVSSIEGSLESIALITEEYDNALCSTGFHVVQSDVLNSKVLLVLLKSIVGQLQLKKGCSGTILTAINKEEFSKIAVPKIKEKKQTEIEQKVLESFNLRKRAKDLLEHAKSTVEIAIEQDEQTAINWLESVLQVA